MAEGKKPDAAECIHCGKIIPSGQAYCWACIDALNDGECHRYPCKHELERLAEGRQP